MKRIFSTAGFGICFASVAAQAQTRTLKPSDFAGSFQRLIEEASPGAALASRYGSNIPLPVSLDCQAAEGRLRDCVGSAPSGGFNQKVADNAAAGFMRFARLKPAISGPVTIKVRLLINPE